MKHRTTYLVNDASATLPDNFVRENDSLHIKHIDAAREDRITIPHDELPAHILSALQRTQTVTMRWSTGRPYDSVDPFASRVPAGLHVLVSGGDEGCAAHAAPSRLR